MKSLIISALLSALIWQCGFCQINVRITDVDFHLENNFIVINYKIEGSLPNEHLSIDLTFVTENNEILKPKTVTGDVGTKNFGNGAKSIQWDIVTDKVSLSGNLKASVTVTSSKVFYGGPSNALLSVVVPGLGGYFVEKNKTRAIATTITTLGLLGYGISQHKLSNKYYDDYKASEDPADIDAFYNKANEAHHKAYISSGLAIGIWAFDIIWVTVRGYRNMNDAKSYDKSFRNDGLGLNYLNDSWQLKYSVSF